MRRGRTLELVDAVEEPLLPLVSRATGEGRNAAARQHGFELALVDPAIEQGLGNRARLRVGAIGMTTS
jgi:hypothetical protein